MLKVALKIIIRLQINIGIDLKIYKYVKVGGIKIRLHIVIDFDNFQQKYTLFKDTGKLH